MGVWVYVLSVDLHTSLVLRIEPAAISWNYCTTLPAILLLLLKNKWCLGWSLLVLRSGGQETNWGSVLSTLLVLRQTPKPFQWLSLFSTSLLKKMCVCAHMRLCLLVCLCSMCVAGTCGGQNRVFGPLEYGCELPGGCWELTSSLGPPQKQQELLLLSILSVQDLFLILCLCICLAVCACLQG